MILRTLILLVHCFLATSLEMKCTQIRGPPAGLKQIDAGMGQVYGVNNKDKIFTLSGSTWSELLWGNWKHVTVGPSGVWAVDRLDHTYQLVDQEWFLQDGSLKQVDAGGPGIVAGVNKVNNTFCKGWEQEHSVSVVKSPWTHIPGSMKYYSCGLYGCWGVHKDGDIYLRTGVKAGECRNTGHWWLIRGVRLEMVEVGTDGSVFGVDSNGGIYCRTGISAKQPAGGGWNLVKVPYIINHMSYDQGHLWVITTDSENNTQDCTLSEYDAKRCEPVKLPTEMKCTQIRGPPAGLKQIDAGMGQVYGVNNKDKIFTRSGSTWSELLWGNWKHVTVGPSGVWAVDRLDHTYQLVDQEWFLQDGSLKQVDAGGPGIVAGVNKVNNTFCKGCKGSKSSWTHITESIKYYSCGLYGCWGVGTNQLIYLRTGVTVETCTGTGDWLQITGVKLDMVEVGTDGKVFGVTPDGLVYRRTGISLCQPAGTGWTYAKNLEKIKHVSYDLGHLWLITKSNTILDCTQRLMI